MIKSTILFKNLYSYCGLQKQYIDYTSFYPLKSLYLDELGISDDCVLKIILSNNTALLLILQNNIPKIRE